MNATAAATKTGKVVQIIGPVVDVEFPPDGLPEINTALEMDIELEGTVIKVTAEVAQQIGEHYACSGRGAIDTVNFTWCVAHDVDHSTVVQRERCRANRDAFDDCECLTRLNRHHGCNGFDPSL